VSYFHFFLRPSQYSARLMLFYSVCPFPFHRPSPFLAFMASKVILCYIFQSRPVLLYFLLLISDGTWSPYQFFFFPISSIQLSSSLLHLLRLNEVSVHYLTSPASLFSLRFYHLSVSTSSENPPFSNESLSLFRPSSPFYFARTFFLTQNTFF